ncbi:MAG: hypothetical protein ACI978_002925, partial [Oleispira sp.]
MNKVLLSLVIGCVYQSAFSQDISDDFSNDFSEDMGWEEESMLMDELPMVLTASRLKQP